MERAATTSPGRDASRPDADWQWVSCIRRFTRPPTLSEKKIENHFYAIASHFKHNNCVRTHQTLRVNSAMAAAVSKIFWTMDDVVKIAEDWEGG